MSSSASGDPRATRRTALRRAILHLVLAVIALDAAAMAVYFLGGVSAAEPRTRMIFTVVWTMTTAFVVAVLLRRVRLIRRGA